MKVASKLPAAEDINRKLKRLFDAIRRDDLKEVDRLVQDTPTLLDLLDWGGTGAIHLACMLHRFQAAELLIRQGANLLLDDKSGMSALWYIKDEKAAASLKDLHFKISHRIVEEEVPLSPLEMSAKALKSKIYAGDVDYVYEVSSKEPAIVNFQDRRGNTPLMFACLSSQIIIATALLHLGADSTIRNCYNQDALSMVVDYSTRQELSTLAFDLSAEGIVAAEKRRLENEQACEERERVDMHAADTYAALFASLEHKFMAQSVREMRQEEKDTRVFLKKLRLMHVSVRKEVSRLNCQQVISEAVSKVTVLEVQKIRDEKETRRQLEIADRKREKANKVRKLRALLHDADVLQAGLDGANDLTIADEDLDEESVMKALIEKERRKEVERQAEAEAARLLEEKKKVELRQKAIREAERVARLEWNQLQADIRKKDKEEFERNKPLRLAKLCRQRRAMSNL